jgi:hypothetical protein
LRLMISQVLNGNSLFDFVGEIKGFSNAKMFVIFNDTYSPA